MRSSRMYVLVLCLVMPLAAPLLYAQNLSDATQKIPAAVSLPPPPAQELTTPPLQALDLEKKEVKKDRTFLDFIDSKVYAATIEKRDEKKILREDWRQWLGMDIYYPYFKAKEVEDWACDRFKVKFFKISGRPKIEDNQFRYTFKAKF